MYICIYDEHVGTGESVQDAFNTLQDCCHDVPANDCTFYEGIPVEVELQIKMIKSTVINKKGKL